MRPVTPRRLAAAGVVVVAVLVAGCGDQASPVSADVPEVGRLHAQVVDAVEVEDWAAARSSLAALVEVSETARDDGVLDDARADLVVTAAEALAAGLPAGESDAPATADEEPAAEQPVDEQPVDEQPAEEPADSTGGDGTGGGAPEGEGPEVPATAEEDEGDEQQDRDDGRRGGDEDGSADEDGNGGATGDDDEKRDDDSDGNRNGNGSTNGNGNTNGNGDGDD